MTSDLGDITVLTLMTHQVLHGREELFRKVRQAAEGGANLRLSVWVTVDRQLLHRVDVLLQVRHVVWWREGGTVSTGSDKCVSICVFLWVCTLSWCVFGFSSFLHLLQHQPVTVQNLNTEHTMGISWKWVCVCVCAVCVCVCVCSCRVCWEALIHLLTQHTHTEDELCSLTTGSYIPVWVSSV